MTAPHAHPRIVSQELTPSFREILTSDALNFVAGLQREFDQRRRELLAEREVRQAAIAKGESLGFLAETAEVRSAEWRVAEAPVALQDRRVEITGPADRKMMINALNSGARVFMADFEDSLTPTWANLLNGQINAVDAVRRTLRLVDPARDKLYELAEDIAVMIVRPRGWQLVEKHVQVDGIPMSAALFDFGLYLFHNARELLERNLGPYFYLPKLESHQEARLWNDVFNLAQDELGIPRGSIMATVLIETIPAAFEMDEILFELRDHAAGLNAGRWDYIFSVIKKFRDDPQFVLPDRGLVTMGVPFMQAYSELLVETCHRRGAHAIGGMAAFIPSRSDSEVTEHALRKVREDKRREAGAGFDGTWVAHPDLVPVAQQCFDEVLGGRPHQKERRHERIVGSANALLDVEVPGGDISEAGVRNNISVALQYLNAWLMGTGAVAISHMMEDAATAEISRAQLWQWIRHRVRLSDGTTMSAELYRRLRNEELSRLPESEGGRIDEAARLLDDLVLSHEFTEFLTLDAYERID